MADEQQPQPGAVDPQQFQAALGHFFAQQFGQINAAENEALNQQKSNQQKIQAEIDKTLAQALMGSGGSAQGAVQFPPQVFDLAVALTKQPALQGPIMAFYKQLQAQIDKAVQEQLEKFSTLAGGSDGQGSGGDQGAAK